MKTFLKKHGFVLILFFILTWAIYNGSQIFVKQMDRNEKKTAQILADCKKNMSESEDLNYKKMCENLINNNLPDLDFFTMLTNLVVFELRYLNFIALFIVVLPSMKVAKLLKSKYILHSATRESYRSFLITFFKKAYQYVFILPCVGGILLFFCAIHTTFDPTYALQYQSSIWEASRILHPVFFILGYLLNLFLYSIFYLNLFLIVLRKKHNLIVALLLTVLLFLGIELFFEVGLNTFIGQMLFKSEIGYLFNIMSPFTFSNQFHVSALLSFSLFMVLLSSYFVYKMYHHREKFIMDCEKNN
ncbi:MAG: hypothetical protein HFJ02_02615 [Bacilli bacterium]|nr:hypothetical protein [Bacilli bacterium]